MRFAAPNSEPPNKKGGSSEPLWLRYPPLSLTRTFFGLLVLTNENLPCPAVPFAKAWGYYPRVTVYRLVHTSIPHNRTPCGGGTSSSGLTRPTCGLSVRFQPASLTSCAYFSTFVLTCQGFFWVFWEVSAPEVSVPFGSCVGFTYQSTPLS